MTPPAKTAEVVENGRYMPTAISIGAGALIRIKPMANAMPMITNGQAIMLFKVLAELTDYIGVGRNIKTRRQNRIRKGQIQDKYLVFAAVSKD